MLLSLAKLMTELFGKFTIDIDAPIIIRVNYRNEEGYLVAFDEGAASRVAGGIDTPMIVIESKNFTRQEILPNTAEQVE